MSKLNDWWHNKYYNPYTNRKIKKNGKVYNKLLKECMLGNHIKDNYTEVRGKTIDPLTFLNLPLVANKKLYKYEYCWDPLDGSIIGKDPRGPLYFDPDTLVHYFYTNRIRYLWVDGDNNFTGRYDDGVGNGPDFYINGRGYSPHYYLFRLPIPDAYCDSISKQQTTIGPILDYNDIKNIYKLSKTYGNNYENLFGFKRPNLIEIYNLYHKAIEKVEYDYDSSFYESFYELGLSKKDVEENKFLFNRNAVNSLRNL